ncbi:LEPR-XLL domain-containing protein [Vibrio sp. 99-8-1]|uniref:LEPR-XLL domain-containing protein n=1 Tax=Vibrio sp. 99-8-1 TaxID=2607602 RepID=UPI0014936D86|nr:LEPR-XLL domain-containing protein [Vibrio sp. 99-8-1]NOI65300.1 calcium-binding protein [Vibrio sp. 99-8-1]
MVTKLHRRGNNTRGKLFHSRRSGRLPQLRQLVKGISSVLSNKNRDAIKVPMDNFRLEQLEPRLLLSADPIATFSSDNDNAQLTLEVVTNEANEQIIQLVDTTGSDSKVIGSKKISDIPSDSIIQVNGGDGNDTLTVDQSFLDLGDRDFVLQFDGGEGNDRVQTAGNVTASKWQIDGEHSGAMGSNGLVRFENIEKINATTSEDSEHSITTINHRFNWHITGSGKGTLSLLQDNSDSLIKTPAYKGIEFSGIDHINGSGSDYLDYSQHNQSVTVNLEEGKATGFDAVFGINTVIGSSKADTLIGDDNNNTFVAGVGDKIKGQGGVNNTVYKLDKTDGKDIKLTAGASENRYLYQIGQFGSEGGFTSNHTIDIENIQLLSTYGNEQDNKLDFSAAKIAVHLDGRSGEDTLLGGSGNDILTGGAGNDLINGNEGDDEVVSIRTADFVMKGNAVLIGSSEQDTLENINRVYLKALSAEGDTTGKRLDASEAGDAENPYSITLVGTELKDTIKASKYGDMLIGFGGSDEVTGGVGHDTFYANNVGKAEVKALSSPGYQLTLTKLQPLSEESSVTHQVNLHQFDSKDTLSLSGSAYNDVIDISAFSGHGIIHTHAGNDSITGAQAGNVISSGEGNDTIVINSARQDKIDAGTGTDKLVVDLSTEGDGTQEVVLTGDTLSITEAESTIDGVELASLIGGDGDDHLDASAFHGVTRETKLVDVKGWQQVATKTLHIQLDDSEQSKINIDVSEVATLADLIQLINESDSRTDGKLTATFDQNKGGLTLTGLSAIEAEAGSEQLLTILGLSEVVSSSTLNGIGLSLLASAQRVSFTGNGGKDSYYGSSGNDRFNLAAGDQTVTGNSGNDTIVAATNDSHTSLIITDDSVSWKDSDGVLVTTQLIGSEAQKFSALLKANDNAILLDGSASSMQQVLDAGDSNATLKGGSGAVEFRVDISNRTDIDKQKVSALLNNDAENRVVAYGGDSELSKSDFSWVTINESADFTLVKENANGINLNTDVTFKGISVELKATNGSDIVIKSNIDTGNEAGGAGNIRLIAQNITISDGVSLLAVGNTEQNSGDISLLATHSENSLVGGGFYNIDKLTASITINSDVAINGKNITLLAKAVSNPYSNLSHNQSSLSKPPAKFADDVESDEIKNALDSLSLFAGYSHSDVSASISVAESAEIKGSQVTIDASTIAKVDAKPLSAGVSVALGKLDASATVNMNGNIIASGDVSITTRTDNYLNVVAKPIIATGFSESVAIGVIDSKSSATVSSSANIVAGGDLTVQSRNFDFSYVAAISDGGNEGKQAASAAVKLTNNETVATLAGTVLVAGDAKVNAEHIQGKVNGHWGTKAKAEIDRVPSKIDKIKDGLKEKAAKKAPKSMASKLMPGNRLAPTKLTAGLAFVYANESNTVNSYIGQVGQSSDIQVAGDLSQSATVNARLITSTSSSASTPSQYQQVAGSAGTGSSFKQVPFGGAVSVSIGELSNSAEAHIQGNTQLDVLKSLSVQSVAKNQTGIAGKNSDDIALLNNKPSVVNKDDIGSNYAVKKGDLLQFVDGKGYVWQQSTDDKKPAISKLDAIYKFIGDDSNVVLATEDFSDASRWLLLGDKVTYLPNHLLNGNNDFYLADNSVKAVAAGAKVSLALNFAQLESKQISDSRVKGNVKINQRSQLSNSFVDEDGAATTQVASSASKLLEAVPNSSSRSVHLTSFSLNQSVDTIGNTSSTKTKLFDSMLGSSSSENGVGASRFSNKVVTVSQSVIESGAKVDADTLTVNAESKALVVNYGNSHGSGRGLLGVAGLSMRNTIDSTSRAQIESGVTANIGSDPLLSSDSAQQLRVEASNTVDVFALGLGKSKANTLGLGTAHVINDVSKTTDAVVGSDGSNVGNITVHGDSHIEAVSDGSIIATAMSGAKIGRSVAPTQTSSGQSESRLGIGISGTYIANKLTSNVSSSLRNVASFTSDDLSLNAKEQSNVIAFPLAYSKASSQNFSLAAAGVGLLNTVDITVIASMENINSANLNAVTVNATNDSQVIAVSTAAAYAKTTNTSNGSKASAAIAGNISLNKVTSTINAHVSDVNALVVREQNGQGYGVDIVALDQSKVYAGALGVAYAGNVAVDLTTAENSITSDINAHISHSDITLAQGKVRVEADNSSGILAVALGASLTKGSSLGLSVGAALSLNTVRSTTRAKVNRDSVIRLASADQAGSKINITAKNDAEIQSYVTAASVSAQLAEANDQTFKISLSGAGAEAINNIFSDTEASVVGSTIKEQLSSEEALTEHIGITIEAEDSSAISSVVLAGSAGLAKTQNGVAASLALGVSLAENNIGDSDKPSLVRAYAKDSHFNTSGSLNISAKSTTSIDATVVAASVAVVAGKAAVGLSGVGAKSDNSVYTNVQSYVEGGEITSRELSVASTSKASIDATVATAVLVAAVGKDVSASLNIAASIAKNSIHNDTIAYIAGDSASSKLKMDSGDITVSSVADNNINAVSAAASLAVAVSSKLSVALSGAGALAENIITGDTKAYITNSDISSTTIKPQGKDSEGNDLPDLVLLNSRDITVSASNISDIDASVIAASASVAVGAKAGIGVSIGVGKANNYIGNDDDRLQVYSYIENSNINVKGDVDVVATSNLTVDADVTVASMAVTGSGGGGLALSASGIGVSNEIYSLTTSYIKNSNELKANNVSVGSSNTSNIKVTAIAASVAASFAPKGAAVSIGISKVSNLADMRVRSYIDSAKITSNNKFDLVSDAKANLEAKGYAVSIAGGIGFSGAGVIVNSDIKGYSRADVINSTLKVGNKGNIKALSDMSQSVHGYGLSVGFIAAGIVLSEVETKLDTLVTFENSDYSGNNLSISAYSNEDHDLVAIAGSGGLVAGAGVSASVTSSSNTQVDITKGSRITLERHVNNDVEADGAEKNSAAKSGQLSIKAEHVTAFDADVKAASGGVLSGSGAIADNEISANVHVNLGDDSTKAASDSGKNVAIKAENITVDAINRVRKDDDGRIYAVAAGIYSAAGADSRTELNLDTKVRVGKYNDIYAISGDDNNGIALNALNDVVVKDEVVMNAVGAAAGTFAKVKIKDSALNATVEIAEGARIFSSGDVQISARGKGEFVASVESDSAGAVSVTKTSAIADITPTNTVVVDEKAKIAAYGDLNISAGTDTLFNRDQYKVHASVDSFAASVIPVDIVKSDARLVQSNTITVGTGAHLQTAKRMNLHAERFGFADMASQTKTVNWASKLGGTADLGGDLHSSAEGKVINAGKLETGIQRHLSIEFNQLDDNGLVDDAHVVRNENTVLDGFGLQDNEILKGITYSSTVAALNSSLLHALEDAERQLILFRGSVAGGESKKLVVFYEKEVKRLQQQLKERGLLEEVKPNVFIRNEVRTPVIVLNDIHAEAGRVDVRADDFEQKVSSEIVVPGDASIKITNHTIAALVVNNITIPQENGGSYLNGEVLQDGGTTDPSIVITNDVDIDLAKKALAERFADQLQVNDPDDNETSFQQSLVVPSITVAGNIENRTGSLTLRSLKGVDGPKGTGDITINGKIDTKENEIYTGGSATIGLPPGSTFSTSGEEYNKWNSVIGNYGLDRASPEAIDDMIKRNADTASIYADSISITAEFININGKIQSGTESFKLTIDDSIETQVNNIKRSGASGLVRLNIENKDFSVYYDVGNDQIVVGDMRVSGGYIRLEGNIMNTNKNSQIELLGGYAGIEVINNTQLDVKIMGLDASQRGEGTLIIKDKSKSRDGEILETIYTKSKDGLNTIQRYGEEIVSSASGDDVDLTYTPKQGWRYKWSMAEEEYTRNRTVESKSSWAGIDALSADPDDIDFDPEDEKTLSPAQLTGKGAYFELIDPKNDNDAPYLYFYEKVKLSDQTFVTDKWKKSTWWGKKTYYTEFTRERKYRNVATHSIKADYGIAINFTGAEQGSVTVKSNRGGDVIVQGNISNEHGTTIIEAAGSGIYSSETASVGGKIIDLTADEIGYAPAINIDKSINAARTALRTNLTNDSSASLSARTYGGRINIVENDGPLMAGNITSASDYERDSLDSGGKIFLSAIGGIEAATSGSVVRGGVIDLNTEAHVGRDTLALNIDGGSLNKDALSIKANSNIFVSETDGDLRVNSIQSSAGSVHINVAHGSLIDANTNVVRDERSYSELSTGLWKNLGLIDGSDAAEIKRQQILDAAKNAKQSQYHQYWQIINSQFGGEYSAGQKAVISDSEKSYFTEQFTQQGIADGKSGAELEAFVADGIETLNNKRDAEFQQLHDRYAGTGAYDADYSAELSESEIAKLTGHIVKWSENDLLNLVSGSLLKPVTNTQATIEGANITAGKGVHIQAKTDVGSANGSVEIVLDNNYSEQQRVQLAAAERNDVYFLFSQRVTNITVDVVDSVAGDQIVRQSGSWREDGFVAGMQIRIAGDSANSNNEGTFYEIASISSDGTRLILTSTDLTSESSVDLDIAAISNSPTLTTIVSNDVNGWDNSTYQLNDYIETEGNFYQIQRISGQVMDLKQVDGEQAAGAVIVSASKYHEIEVEKVLIDQREDIDILAVSDVNVSASRNLYLGSEKALIIAHVSADNVRIKSKESLIDAASSNAAVTATSSLVLEAGYGAIGSEAQRFTIDLGTDGLLTARAKNSIVLTEVNSTINVGTLYSANGKVDLLASNGSIVDALNHDYENIRAKDIELTALHGAIGETGDRLDIHLTGGNITANSRDDIRLNETDISMNIDHIESLSGDVDLHAQYSIIDAVDDQVGEQADIVGASISLTARTGSVGAFGEDIEIDSGSKAGDNLTIDSELSSYVIETMGDLYLNSIKSGLTATAFIAVPTGRILNDNKSGQNLESGKAYLFAASDIGEFGRAITTRVGHLQGKSTSGNAYIVNDRSLNIGGVLESIPDGITAGGSVSIVTKNSLTISKNIVAGSEVNLTTIDRDSESDNESITIKDGFVVKSRLSEININAGDDVIVEQNGQLSAKTDINIYVDKGLNNSVDDSGGHVDLAGHLYAGERINIHGNTQDDSVDIHVQNIGGDVYVNSYQGEDRITISQLHSRSGKMVLDGGADTDRYTINRTGNDADYVIDVVDSGLENQGADTLTINGTELNDTFLLRANFVAALHGDSTAGYSSNVERINYNRNINARLTVNGLQGDDAFYSDDNSSITTLDGGKGNDSFQIGQLFGSDRKHHLGVVAQGDDIETTETTLGFLSKGNSLPMVVYGGDGEDQITVYSNKAITKLYGEDGDDNFVVRAFLQKGSNNTTNSVDVELFGGDGADNIEYSINAPLKIDGGAGVDTVVVLGTEADDNFIITENGIFGAGLNIGYQGVEIAEVDGLEGDDTFYVLSTNEDVTTTIIGGLGSDNFHVAGDVTKPVVSYSVEGRSSFINHSVFSDDPAYNGIFVNGLPLNVANKDTGAVTIDTEGDMTVSENGLESSYKVSLDVPKPDVATVAYITVSAARVSSSDRNRGNSSNPTGGVLISTDGVNFYESLVLTYDSETNWGDDFTIHVKAIDDGVAEGVRQYVVSHSIRSTNPEFDNLNINNVELTTYDNDQAGVIVVQKGPASIAEGSKGTEVNVTLTKQPDVGEVVTVKVSEIVTGDNKNQLSFVDQTLTFTHSNWNSTQTVLVNAIDDSDTENSYRATVQFETSSNIADSGFSSLNTAESEINIIVEDNDKGAVLVTASHGSTVVNSEKSDSYSLVLSRAPKAPVTVNLLNDGQTLFSCDDKRFNAEDNSVTFTAENWNEAITITLNVNPDYDAQSTSQPVQKPPLQPHLLTQIRGKLNIHGGVPEGKERTLTQSVMLPSESDTELPIVDIQIDENNQTDTLTLFNDGSVESSTGELTASTITGLGMGAGVEYHNVEVVETLLGSGEDKFTVSGTAKGAITLVHGGGGVDKLTVTGSDSDGALILLGDTVQDGSSYNATSDQKTDRAREYDNAAGDFIDASGAGGSVVIYGGKGDDIIIGSQYGDHIAGGSGNDTITGLAGDDHIYGDAGFNVDISTRLDRSSQVLTVVNSGSDSDNQETADTLVTGQDIIYGNQGNDIIIGDKGVISLTPQTNRIKTTGDVINFRTVEIDQGSNDQIYGNEGDDFIIAGNGNDRIEGNQGSDSIIADNGSIDVLQGVRISLTSTDVTEATGGNDTIYLGTGDDQLIAGVGSDTIINTSGESVILGDNGRIVSNASGRYVLARTGQTNLGGRDVVTGGSGQDIIFGGVGSDHLDGHAGNDVIGGDGSQITRNDDTIIFEAVDLFTGGDDTLLGGDGFDRMQGQFGGDLFFANFNEDVLLGDYGRFTFNARSDNEQATSVISLAQGGLDLIRQTQLNLFTGYAKQIFAESNLGQAARSRVAVTTVFTSQAQNAFDQLDGTFQSLGSGASEGADFVIPTAPTAAGVVSEVPSAEGKDNVQVITADDVESSTDAAAEREVEPQQSETQQSEPQQDDVECQSGAEGELCGEEAENKPQMTPNSESTEDDHHLQNENRDADNEQQSQQSGINLNVAIASVGGWVMMTNNPQGQQKKSKEKEKVA